MTTRNKVEIDGKLWYWDPGWLEGLNWRFLDIAANPGAWQDWLKRGESFTVDALHPAGYSFNAYTARLERAKDRKALRWYAYRRTGGKLRKFYLGRSEDLTLERLREVADKVQLVSAGAG